MGRKRKKTDEYPDEWDVIGETQDPDGISPLFETVVEMDDSDADTDAISRLSPPFSEQVPPSVIYRLQETSKNAHSSVICKLTRICHVPELVEEIKHICVVMKQVQLEGWHLANLHLLRCLHEDEELPELTQMFFYRCCTTSLGNIEARDRCTQEPKYPSFHRTCLRYWADRRRTVTYAAESVINCGSMISEMAKMMEINAGNMVALHFRRRLHQYIRFRYTPEGEVQLKYKDTKRLVNSCFRVKMVPVVGQARNTTGTMEKSWTTWDETDDPVEK